jgi:hypothetical protein
MPGVILIDIDGVIAPFAPAPHDRVVGEFAVDEVSGFGDVVILTERIADLVRIAEDTDSVLLLHTSWTTPDANAAFARYFGRELEAVPDPNYGSARAIWWKLDAVEDALPGWAAENRKVVWLDDMLEDENDFGDTWGDLGKAAAAKNFVEMLVIAPYEKVGLLPEHISAIEDFLR